MLAKLESIMLYISFAAIWIVILWMIVPDKWILDYQSIRVQFSCEQPLLLQATSERYPRINVQATGEDNIYIAPYNGGLPVDRISWDGATYRKGTTQDSWPVVLHRPLKPGDYVLVGEPSIKWLFLTRSIEPIISDVFTVTNCPAYE